MDYDIPMKPYGPTAGRDHLENKPKPKTKTVDFHIHMRIQEADKLIGDNIPDDSTVQFRFASKASKEQTLKHHSERMPFLTDMNYRLPDMEKMQEIMSSDEMKAWDKKFNCVDEVYSLERMN